MLCDVMALTNFGGCQMRQSEVFQRLWREFEDTHDHQAISAREVVDWAVRNRALPLPQIDPHDVLASQMSRALRAEYAIDARGRRYRLNHAIRITRNGVQYTMWGILGYADYDHMKRAFMQRREQIVRDLTQLQVDVEVYNGMKPEQPPIQLQLDFTDDIAQHRAA